MGASDVVLGQMPRVEVSPRGAALLRGGHPFVPQKEVLRAPTDAGHDEQTDVVLVQDGRGTLLGSALFAPQSRIALRALSRHGRPLDDELLRERILLAEARRRALGLCGAPGTEGAYRVVHGEADLLPGLFVDRYGDAAVIQTSAAAMDRREGRIAEVVRQALGVSLVVARDDGSGRDMDQLPRRKGVLLDLRKARGSDDSPDTVLRYRDAGSLVEVDLLTDGKTGGFLDQQENHALAHDYARALPPGSPALDTFTYHGGFALALARAGLSVLACDESPQAVLRARRNAELNGVKMDVQVHNAFDHLRALEAAGRRFALVVVDPPALTKRGQHGPQTDALAAARRAYKELNLRALRLLSPGGLLFTCSCSGKLPPFLFGEMLEEAARDVGRPVQLLERRGAGRDHPVMLGVHETEYLKCWVLRATD